MGNYVYHECTEFRTIGEKFLEGHYLQAAIILIFVEYIILTF